MQTEESMLYVSPQAAEELLAGTLKELVVPASLKLAKGQRFRVQEAWLKGAAGYRYRADPLPCGHTRECAVIVVYRCSRGPTCLRRHSAQVCNACMAKGVRATLPEDFGREIRRRQVPGGVWRTGLRMPREASRYVLVVESVRRCTVGGKGRRNDGRGPRQLAPGQQALRVRFTLEVRPPVPHLLPTPR